MDDTKDNIKEKQDAILQSMKRLSKFAFYEGIGIRYSQNSMFLNDSQVEKKIYEGRVAESDFYTLREIAELDYCNDATLIKALNRMVAREPHHNLSRFDKDTVQKTTLRLCRASLIRVREFETRDEKAIIKLYNATPQGMAILRNFLYYKNNKPQMNHIQPDEEMFRRCVANFVGVSMTDLPEIKKHYPAENVKLSSGKRRFLYSRLEGNKNGEKFNVIIEPVYFHVNQNRISEIQLVEYIKERFALIKEVLECDEYKNSYVVFVVEDLEGLKKAAGLVMSELGYLFDVSRFLFTSEPVVYDVQDISDCFLDIRINGDSRKVAYREQLF